MQQGFCFGFVEFEELSSMQSALEVYLVEITILDEQKLPMGVCLWKVIGLTNKVLFLTFI